MLTATHHLLAPDPPHYAWDNSPRPRLTVGSGDTITFATRDASDGHFRLESTSADVATYAFRGHPLTGPVCVEGARPGDCVCSVAVDLKISEVVDAPNWIVSAFLPLDIVRT